MNHDAILFWFLAAITMISGLTVVLVTNPIYSALALAMTMVGVSALFVTLNAYFIAGVQLIVYAGAVMVLFVMVLMLFDLKQEIRAFTRGKFTGMIKIISSGMLAGIIIGSIYLSVSGLNNLPADPALAIGADSTKKLGQILFAQYVFGFEALGVLLLIVAIGCVALARSKGGTHASH